MPDPGVLPADQRAIEAVLVRYALACDTRDWSLFDTVFSPAVEANYGGEYRLQGREAVVGMIRHLLGGCGPTQHLLGNFRITVDGDTARCACYVRAAHAGKGSRSALLYEVWAEYRDTLARVDGDWRITARQMVVSHETGTREVLQP